MSFAEADLGKWNISCGVGRALWAGNGNGFGLVAPAADVSASDAQDVAE